MRYEIERKFLVRGDAWKKLAAGRTYIRQAYLMANENASIRVRIKGDHSATLTIKSRGADRRRLELEYDIPTLEAEALILLCRGLVIEKHRYEVPWGTLAWEIDVFSGENAGLTIAEIELQHETQLIELPPWVGAEVTGKRQYHNGSLAQCPFQQWAAVEPA